MKTAILITLSLLALIPIARAQDNLERLDYSKTPRYYIIGNVSTSPLEHVNAEYLIEYLNLVPGDSIQIPGDKIKDTYRQLWDQRHFSDVKIETTFRRDTVDIMLALTERFRVSNWEFEGIKTGDQKALKEKLKYRKMSEYSEFMINTHIKLIREYYDQKAYRFADISYKVSQDSTKPSYKIVTYKINKGPKVRIGDIKFEGASALSSKSLAKSMKNTNKKTMNFFKNSKFKDKEFSEDLTTLAEYMHSQGYRDGRVLADSLYKISDKRIGVWIKISEGKKHYFRNITWIGNSVYLTDDLKLMLQLKSGDVYDSETLESRLGTRRKDDPTAQSISSLYKDNGYLAFRIEPIETVVKDSVDVEVRIIEGKPFRIDAVTFEGNTRTNDHVIRRELSTEPGELYSQSLLMRSYQRLASMGQFDQQSINPERIPNIQNETVEIKYTFKEISNDQLELSGGWGGGMFIASVGLNFTNVAIRNFLKPSAWRPYPAGDNQQLGIKVQSNGTYYQAYSINFTEPWLGGRKPNSLSVGLFTSKESNSTMLGSKATQFFSTVGGSVSFGKRLQWPDPYFQMSTGISVQSYKLKDWQYFLMANGRSNTVALNFSFARNSIDDPYLYPTRGSNMSISLALTPPFSAFDKKDYSDAAMSQQDRYRWIEYHKWKINAQWFMPLTYDGKLVMMARAQYGYLGYYDKNKRSPFEGFTMGGDGLSGYSLYGSETVGLRGYENNSLTPNAGYSGGQYASVYSKYIAEMRYPLVREGATLVYGLLFAEAGNAYVKASDFNPFSLKRSAGFGVRINLPVVGLLGIDIAYGFDKPTATSTSISGWQPHFTMGVQL